MAPKHRLYTPEVAETILERLSDGEGLATICRDVGMPTEGAVRYWASTDYAGFAARYAQARVRGLEKMADDIITLADEAKDVDSASAARVKVDARKWLLSKLLPRQFGDRVDVNVTGALEVRAIPDASLDDRLKTLLTTREPLTIEGKAEPESGGESK